MFFSVQFRYSGVIAPKLDLDDERVIEYTSLVIPFPEVDEITGVTSRPYSIQPWHVSLPVEKLYATLPLHWKYDHITDGHYSNVQQEGWKIKSKWCHWLIGTALQEWKNLVINHADDLTLSNKVLN